MDWQPIASAPKDGMEVLLYDGRYIVIGHWMEANYFRDGEPARWFPRAAPTHWMPLPAPPSTQHPTR